MCCAMYDTRIILWQCGHSVRVWFFAKWSSSISCVSKLSTQLRWWHLIAFTSCNCFMWWSRRLNDRKFIPQFSHLKWWLDYSKLTGELQVLAHYWNSRDPVAPILIDLFRLLSSGVFCAFLFGIRLFVASSGTESISTTGWTTASTLCSFSSAILSIFVFRTSNSNSSALKLSCLSTSDSSSKYTNSEWPLAWMLPIKL